MRISSPTFTSRNPVPKAAANRRIVCHVSSLKAAVRTNAEVSGRHRLLF
jgi:hypothetical protein